MTLDEIIQKINAAPIVAKEEPGEYLGSTPPQGKIVFDFEEGLFDALGSHLGVLAPRGVQDAIQRLVAEVDGPRLRAANHALANNAAFTSAMQRLSEWRMANAAEK